MVTYKTNRSTTGVGVGVVGAGVRVGIAVCVGGKVDVGNADNVAVGVDSITAVVFEATDGVAVVAVNVAVEVVGIVVVGDSS